MPYDLEHEAMACVSELFYRRGPVPISLRPNDTPYIKETIMRYLQEAQDAVREKGR